MSKMKTFKMIMEKSDSNRAVFLTESCQIVGDVCDFEECNKYEYINLRNVKMCSLNNIYDGICESDINYEWLHINLDNVIAYSFLR